MMTLTMLCMIDRSNFFMLTEEQKSGFPLINDRRSRSFLIADVLMPATALSHHKPPISKIQPDNRFIKGLSPSSVIQFPCWLKTARGYP
jgi:hypothetical protein